jgi:hypothetical protein
VIGRIGGIGVMILRNSKIEVIAIPDGVTSSETDPLRNWSVLLLCLCKLLLGSETLVTLLKMNISIRLYP